MLMGLFGSVVCIEEGLGTGHSALGKMKIQKDPHPGPLPKGEGGRK